jgi:hypothetical protein
MIRFGTSWEARAVRSRSATLLVLIALVGLVIVDGVIPALSRIDTDFPNYLTAAKIVSDGGDTERLYDDSWFRAQMRRYGMGSGGRFLPFTPPTALLLLPLAHLQPLAALRVVTVVSVLCLVVSIALLAKTLSWDVLATAVFVLSSGHAILNGLRFGQPYIVVSAFCILGYCAYVRGKPLLAGLCFGLFVPIKYYPLIYLAYFAVRREWQIVLGGAISGIAVAAASIALLGWRVHETYVLSVLGNHLTAHIGNQDPFTATFQSFDTLFRRLFVFDPALNPHPFLAAPLLQLLGVAVTKISIALLTIAALAQLVRRDAANATAPALGILGVSLLLIAPATGTYYFVLLWLPVGLLITHFLGRRALLPAYLTVAAYALIGFFPYSFTQPFEGRGGLTVLAYPRLFLLAVLFATSVCFALRGDRTPVGAPVPREGT